MQGSYQKTTPVHALLKTQPNLRWPRATWAASHVKRQAASVLLSSVGTLKLNQRVVVTGGAGAGKTALLTALAVRGYAHVPESARAIIQDRKRRGLAPRPPPAEFAQEILRVDVERYRCPSETAGYTFFDRGILDALCMLDQLRLLTPVDTSRYLADYPYFRTVFALPPWQQIYKTDDERDQTFVEAVGVHDTLCGWYVACGYEVLEVPRTSVEKRCEFILQMLEKHRRPDKEPQ